MEQSVIRPKKGQYVKSENYERKRKSPSIIYADSENFLVLGDKGKQNPYKYQYHKQISKTYCL